MGKQFKRRRSCALGSKKSMQSNECHILKAIDNQVNKLRKENAGVA